MKKKYIIFDDKVDIKNNSIKNNIDDINQDNLNIIGIKPNNLNTYPLSEYDNTKTNVDKNIGLNVNNNSTINNNNQNQNQNKTNIETENDDNNVYLKELIKKQKKNISSDKKLDYNDIKRISKFLSSSIFDKNKCSIWNGYITNEKNQSKGTYVNFYFNKKKIALHRLLYINYVEDVHNNEYIKFSCLNKGKCCNINHMKKYLYNKNINESTENKDKNDKNNDKDKDKEKKSDTKSTNDHISINLEKNKLIVEL